jgi:hypothetical protein
MVMKWCEVADIIKVLHNIIIIISIYNIAVTAATVYILNTAMYRKDCALI